MDDNTKEKECFRITADAANEVYALLKETEDDYKLNHIGWTNTFAKKPFLAHEMYEWRDDILDMVLSVKPERVLEIGCALDISKQSVEYIHSHMTKEQKRKSALYVMNGFDIDKLDDKYFDPVIINSVSQYLGGEDCFTELIRKCTDKSYDLRC